MMDFYGNKVNELLKGDVDQIITTESKINSSEVAEKYIEKYENNLLKSKEVIIGFKPGSIDKYVYDENQKLLQEIYVSDENEVSTRLYEYDDKGRLVTVKTLNEKTRESKLKKTFSYPKENQVLTNDYYFNGKISCMEHTLFLIEGDLISRKTKVKSYDSEGAEESSSESTVTIIDDKIEVLYNDGDAHCYNLENGNLLSRKLQDKEIVFEHEYDTNENWIKRTALEDGVFPKWTITREISYHQ